MIGSRLDRNFTSLASNIRICCAVGTSMAVWQILCVDQTMLCSARSPGCLPLHPPHIFTLAVCKLQLSSPPGWRSQASPCLPFLGSRESVLPGLCQTLYHSCTRNYHRNPSHDEARGGI